MKVSRPRNYMFVVEVNMQAEILAAPPDKNGNPQKWIPCDHCNKLIAVDLNVVASVCSDECWNCLEYMAGRSHVEISGYSHACGYHN